LPLPGSTSVSTTNGKRLTGPTIGGPPRFAGVSRRLARWVEFAQPYICYSTRAYSKRSQAKLSGQAASPAARPSQGCRSGKRSYTRCRTPFMHHTIHACPSTSARLPARSPARPATRPLSSCARPLSACVTRLKLFSARRLGPPCSCALGRPGSTDTRVVSVGDHVRCRHPGCGPYRAAAEGTATVLLPRGLGLHPNRLTPSPTPSMPSRLSYTMLWGE